MKAVPAKVLALGLAVLLGMGAFLLLEGRPRRAAAESLELKTVVERTAAGQVELHVTWNWNPPADGKGWRSREHLLAVSFDTHALVWGGEEAPGGKGAFGHTLKRLDEVAGLDGARRLFVIPEGEDGYVRLQFKHKVPGSAPTAEPFRVFVVYDSSNTDVWMTEAALPVTAGQMATIKQDF
ncbi:MAG TPA: hypothetical protein VD902_07495 [Symbiobacteriaceae bacterium]|nr:hypothetical protein [Symbiobacteriaceae bacterium]